ncbi:MAG: DUF4271 domain-containing protein [Salinivirgaceae bacterium]|nr:DUF4271 domain-containing protein [Salinivirgaceae bacterium]
MGQNNYYYQVQDTIPQKGIQLNTDNGLSNRINIERKIIEIGDIRMVQVDSSRMNQPKKILPVIKTIPVVPKTDSIEHPEYCVFTNSFYFPEQESLFDGFGTNPMNPSLKLNFESGFSNHKQTQANHGTTLEIAKVNKITITENTRQSHGFKNTDWMLGIIIFLWIVFGWLRVGFGRFFQAAVAASYNYFAARRIQEESNVLRSRVFLFMNLLFFMTLSLFITQWFDFYNYSVLDINGALLFLIILGLLLAIYGLKGFFLAFLDFLFLAKGNFTSYNSTVFIYNKMVGFILLPIVSVIPYMPTDIAPWLFKGSFLMILILYFLRIFRGLQIGFKIRLSIFYLILYLCALEILPVLMLYKLINTLL